MEPTERLFFNDLTMSTKAVKILGLPKNIRLKFRRAIFFSGARSQSEWLQSKIRKLIREQEAIHGDLLNALTPEENEILDAIKDGAAEPEQIAEETLLSPAKVAALIESLLERGFIEARKQGGKTEQARGQRRTLYFAVEITRQRK